MGGLKDAFMLMRLQTALLSASAPVMGLAVSSALLHSTAGWQVYTLLLLQGMTVHAWANALNEYSDREIDRRSEHLDHKPLVSGAVSDTRAFFIMLALLGLCVVLLIPIGPTTTALVSFALALASLGVYNTVGKKLAGSDYILAGGVFFAFMYGYFLIALPPKDKLLIAVLFASAGALQVAFNNSVEGGIKDAETDRKAGASTLAVVMGVRWEDGPVVPAIFIIYAALLRVVHLAVLIYAAYLIGGWNMAYGAAFIQILASGIFFASLDTKERTELLRRFAAVEALTFASTLLAPAPYTGVSLPVLLFIASLVWFGAVNRVMYGRWSAPGV